MSSALAITLPKVARGHTREAASANSPITSMVSCSMGNSRQVSGSMRTGASTHYQYGVLLHGQLATGFWKYAHGGIAITGVPTGKADIVVELVIAVPAQHHIAETKALFQSRKKLDMNLPRMIPSISNTPTLIWEIDRRSINAFSSSPLFICSGSMLTLHAPVIFLEGS